MCCQRQQILRLQNTEIRKLCVMSQSMVSTTSLCQDQVNTSLTWLARHFVWNEQHINIHCREIILIHLKCSCKCQWRGLAVTELSPWRVWLDHVKSMAVSTNRKKLFHSLQWPKWSNNAIFYITSGRGEIVLLHVFSASSAAGVMYRHQSGQHSFMGFY